MHANSSQLLPWASQVSRQTSLRNGHDPRVQSPASGADSSIVYSQLACVLLDPDFVRKCVLFVKNVQPHRAVTKRYICKLSVYTEINAKHKAKFKKHCYCLADTSYIWYIHLRYILMTQLLLNPRKCHNKCETSAGTETPNSCPGRRMNSGRRHSRSDMTLRCSR